MLAGLGGQTGLTLAMQLDKEGFLKSHGVRLIGANAEAIDKAEDRKLFKETMTAIGEPCIPSDIANDVETALAIADNIGYPVIVRPAFTLGGAGGGVAYTEEELREVAYTGLDMSPITQVLIEKYIAGWKEIEFEVMRDSRGQRHRRVQHGELRPGGRAYRRFASSSAPALTLSDHRNIRCCAQAALNIISALEHRRAAATASSRSIRTASNTRSSRSTPA